MRRIVLMGLAGLLITGLGLAVLAQGRGQGNGNAGTSYWPRGFCPLGFTTPNPYAGGWWTRVTPTSPEQEAFLKEVARFHSEIRQLQFQLAATTDPKAREELQSRIDVLRRELHDLQLRSLDIKLQLMRTMERGRGGRGPGGFRGRGSCPYATNLPLPPSR